MPPEMPEIDLARESTESSASAPQHLHVAEEFLSVMTKIHMRFHGTIPEQAMKKRAGRPPKIRESVPDHSQSIYRYQTEDASLLSPDDERRLLVQYCSLRDSISEEREKAIPNQEVIANLEKQETICKHQLANANMRLVASIARNFRNYNLEWGDLMGSGAQGLMEAIKRFDISNTTRLGTYATWWIRQALQNAVAKESSGTATSLSPHHLQECSALYYAEQKILGETGRIATEEELSRQTGMSVDHIRKVRAARSAFSLNATFDDSGDTIGDLIEDPVSAKDGVNNTQREIEEHDLQNSVREVLQQLKSREQRVLRLRFGLDTGDPQSLRDVGEILRISKERVRQIQDRAMKKLRKFNEDHGNILSTFLEE